MSILAGTFDTFGSTDSVGTFAKFGQLNGIAITLAGDLVISDSTSNSVRSISIIQSPGGVVTAGVTTTLAGGVSGAADGQGTFSQFNYPNGLVVGSQNQIYLADLQNNAIRMISQQGYTTTLAGNAAPWNQESFGTFATFYYPAFLAVDSSDVVYLTESYKHIVRSISPQTLVSTISGSGSVGISDGVGTNAKFSTPSGIAIDSVGSANYICDKYNHAIRR